MTGLITLLVLALLLPGVATGADLTLTLGGSGEYDSNIRRRSENVEDNVLFQIEPSIKVHQDRSHDFNYFVDYQPQFEFVVENSKELNDIDHLVDAELHYRASGRLGFYLREEFRYLRSTLRSRQTLDSAAIPVISTGRDRVTVNEVALGALYRFTPILDGEIEVSHRLFDTTRVDRADTTRYGVTAGLLRTLTERQRLGGGVSYDRDEFDETSDLAASSTDGAYAFARWRYEITDILEVDLRAGPSYYVVNQDDPKAFTAGRIPFRGDPSDPDQVLVFDFSDCTPPVGGVSVLENCGTRIPQPRAFVEGLGTQGVTSIGGANGRSTDVDVFVSALIRRRWSPKLLTSLRYRRSPGVASGVGGTVIRDLVSLAADWDFAQKWNWFGRGDFVLRNSVTDSLEIFRVAEGVVAPDAASVAAYEGSQFTAVTGRNKTQTRQYSFLTRLTHEPRVDTSVFVQFTYDEQDSATNTLARGDDFDVWVVSIGFAYVFDPIKLWR